MSKVSNHCKLPTNESFRDEFGNIDWNQNNKMSGRQICTWKGIILYM